MKLQIEDQNLRVRIGEDELRRLLEGQRLESRTVFAGVFSMRCTLVLSESGDTGISGDASHWCITLCAAAVRRLADSLPSREGLSHTLAGNAESDSLTLLFDVDVRDSVRHRRPSR